MGDIEKRPVLATDELRMAAAREVVADMNRAGLIEFCAEAEADDYAADIVKHGSPYADGYRLAKALDRFENWDCTSEFVEHLDGYAGLLNHKIRVAQKEWAERTKPTPPATAGQRVRLASGETGTVDGIYEHGPAQLAVHVDGCPHTRPGTKGRRIVNFEDATPEENGNG